MQNLRLYYMDLVKVSKKNDVPSYEEQYRVENEVQALIERDVLGKIVFPGMHMCRAELTIRTREDGSHSFLFGDGVYGFALHLEMGKKGRVKAIAVRQVYPEKSNEIAKAMDKETANQWLVQETKKIRTSLKIVA